MDDLLSSLPQESINIVKGPTRKGDKYPSEADKPHNNELNPRKKTGHQKLMQTEKSRFNQVLNNQEFKKSPFEALRQAIGQNMKSN